MDRSNKRIALLGIGFAVVFLLISIVLFMPSGEGLFREQRCISCHRFKGQGGMAGPDLTEVTKRRGTVWIMRQIRNAQSHNPESRMPVYDHLGYLEIWAIISYLRSA
ncbi:MAG: c-type cytochrome [Nitrospirae bacterium]|nr:c-type cytochrome [Nitrospirota bacterium]